MVTVEQEFTGPHVHNSFLGTPSNAIINLKKSTQNAMEGDGQYNDYIDITTNSHQALNISQKVASKANGRFQSNKVHIATTE